MKRTHDIGESCIPSKKPYLSTNHTKTVEHGDVHIGFVTDPSQFQGKFPYFRKPTEIGAFSVDLERHFIHDRKKLKKYAPPANTRHVNFNLRAGYNIFHKRDETKKDYLNYILRWILLNTNKFKLNNPISENDIPVTSLFTDFICWRGLLTRLLCTPYENKDSWIIAATLFNKTIYMCEFDTQQKIEMLADQSERLKEMTYWGYKFEQYVTKPDSVGSKVDTDAPVNNSEAFCSVVRSRLENHSFVYSGEVDCFDVENEKQKYIELKTSREIETANQERNFKRFKLIKWWAQSFLIGVEKIICGFRDDDGIVRRLEDYNTIAISKLCRDLHNPWEPSVCFNFVNKFLSYVKKITIEDDARTVYLFSMNPKCNIQSQKLPRNSEYCFLPEWYTSQMHTIK